MGKPIKSQWDFGELFPVEQTRRVFSVSELTAQIRRLLEKEIGAVRVTGEVTNLRLQSSGHIYFTLKDAIAQLSCVLFRGEMQVDRSLVQDGRKVTLVGEVTVYESRGQYQLRVTGVEPQGLGALQAAFEKLKQKLKSEGFFAPERKRPLPRYPKRIGLVTSPTGAAIRDVLHVVQRRNPSLEIVLAACRVQGQGAGEEIAAGIGRLNELHRKQSQAEGQLKTDRDNGHLDLILVTRGGGSLEDLWPFNEEIVARAICSSALPVVSAVGHEIDFTISDFVADVRAATPSAAAEIITEGVYSSCQFLAAAEQRIAQLTLQQLDEKRNCHQAFTQRLSRLHPRRRLNNYLQQLDEVQTTLLRGVKRRNQQSLLLWRQLADRLARVRPEAVLRRRRELLAQTEIRFREQAENRLSDLKTRLVSLQKQLALLGPEQVLARGYSITLLAATGKVLRAAEDAKPGQELRTRLRSGQIRSRVEQ